MQTQFRYTREFTQGKAVKSEHIKIVDVLKSKRYDVMWFIHRVSGAIFVLLLRMLNRVAVMFAAIIIMYSPSSCH